jgi:hypothetical protein
MPDGAPDEREVQYGKYVCVTDRAVGFQNSPADNQRFAGAIQMSPDKQRFFVTIRKVQKVSDPMICLQRKDL